MTGLLQYDPARHRLIADWLVVATVASLPWSTSATSILMVAALIAMLTLVKSDTWVDSIIVVQNIIGSLFNSHLFDFLRDWIYVVGAGIAGGMMLRRRSGESAP